MSEYVSSASARMYIGVNFVARKEILKCVLVLLGFLNVDRKARFCIITDEVYKAKHLYIKSLVVLFLFCPVVIKLCAYFLSNRARHNNSRQITSFFLRANQI